LIVHLIIHEMLAINCKQLDSDQVFCENSPDSNGSVDSGDSVHSAPCSPGASVIAEAAEPVGLSEAAVAAGAQGGSGAAGALEQQLLEELAQELEDEEDAAPFICEHDLGVGVPSASVDPHGATRSRRHVLVRMVSDPKCYAKQTLRSLCFNQCRLCATRARRLCGPAGCAEYSSSAAAATDTTGTATETSGCPSVPQPQRRRLLHSRTLAGYAMGAGLDLNGYGDGELPVCEGEVSTAAAAEPAVMATAAATTPNKVTKEATKCRRE